MKRCLHGGNVQQATLDGISDPVMKVTENSDVDGYILLDLDVMQSAEDGAIREKLWKIIRQHCEVLKGLQR